MQLSYKPAIKRDPNLKYSLFQLPGKPQELDPPIYRYTCEFLASILELIQLFYSIAKDIFSISLKLVDANYLVFCTILTYSFCQLMNRTLQ